MVWIIMPIFITLLYLVIGYWIARTLIKRGQVETPLAWWLVFLLWLPIGVVGGFINLVKKLMMLPRAIADSQINKHC